MRIFLDECVDWRLSRDLSGHELRTAWQMGCAAVKNVDLLTLAPHHFGVVVTVDWNPAFQRDLEARPISVVVLHANTNRLADLKPFVPQLLAVLMNLRPGLTEIR